MQFPHCDARILHAPGECKYCDGYASWQELRQGWGIAFTGHAPIAHQLPCPADHAVAVGQRGDFNQWGGNVARPAPSKPTAHVHHAVHTWHFPFTDYNTFACECGAKTEISHLDLVKLNSDEQYVTLADIRLNT